MKKFWSIRFIVVIYCASIVIGCRPSKQRPSVDKNDVTNDRQKRGMVFQISSTTDTPTTDSNGVEQDSTTVVNEIISNTNKSVTDATSNLNTTNILQEAEVNNDNRNEGNNNPLPNSDEEEMDEIKSRKTRQKTYKCYCEEASYNSDCLKKCQSAKQSVGDDYAQAAFTEMTEIPLEAYTNKVPRTTESAKFSIPYANNVNFDQRVVLANKYPQIYSLYPNSHIKIPKNRLFPIYSRSPYLQYAISYPEMAYNGIAPIKPKYLASALKKPVPKGTYAPSIIGRNFANIQECIKLYGQTVCVIAPTTQAPVPNNEITTTVDFMIGNPMEKKVNEIDESCADNSQHQNMKSVGHPNQFIYQTNTISPLYEIKYPSIHDPNLKASVKIDKLYRVGSNPPKLPNFYVSKQWPYANHFNYGKNPFLNNVQNKHLQKSFNGKYYLNKNNMNVAQVTPSNNDGMQTLGMTTPRPITQKPVYATKYPFHTTPSYTYLDTYDKSRNDYSKEIVSSKETKNDIENKETYEYSTTNHKYDPQLLQILNQKSNSKNSENSYNSHFYSNEIANPNPTFGNTGHNYLQDTNIRQETFYPPCTQQSNHDATVHSNSQNYGYFEDGRETTGYPVQYHNTAPNIRYDYVQDSQFVTNQPINLYNENKKYEAHNILDGIQTIVDNRYVGSQDRGISNYQNLLEHTTIPSFLHPASTYAINKQKSDYQSRYEENLVSSSLQKDYEKINENNYNLAKTNNNFAQGLSPSNVEKDRKIIFSNEYNFNSDTKVTSSEINSHTSNYKISNSIPENQWTEQTTESDINVAQTYQPNYSNDRDSSMITSIRKEYDNDNSRPTSYNHDPPHNHQATYENVNYYKSDSAKSKNNELYYSSNEALKHEKYKNNERPHPQFDYSNFPQSMSRIINEANGQYVNNQYPQYIPGNILEEYPNNHVYDNNDKNRDYNYDPHTTQYDIHIASPPTPIHNYRVNSVLGTDSPNANTNNFNNYVTKPVIPGTDLPEPTSYIDRKIPIYTTLSMPHTTPPSLSYNKKVETANTFTSKTISDLMQDSVKSITALANLNSDEYKKYYNPSTIKPRDDLNIKEPNIQSRRKYPSRLSKQKIRFKMMNDTENLFRGLEQIILNNYDPILSEENTETIENAVPKQPAESKDSKNVAEKILFGNLDEHTKEDIRKYGEAGLSEIEPNKYLEKGSTGTENPIQSVDDIPVTVREDVYSEFTTQATIENSKTLSRTINESLIQSTIRKVLNNFVPGKAEDLMANYGNKNAKEIVGARVSNLLPEIVGTAAIRNLLSVPEVENMIVDVAGGLVGRMANVFLGDVIRYVRKSFRHVVNKEIPRPNPTMAPFTVEEHRFQNGEWVTEQISLLGNSKTDESKSLPREIFDKIKSILSRSKLSEEDAAQPIVQNLIVKAVKHSLHKERGIVQESAIRKAFKIIVKPTKSKSSSLPSYKVAPAAEAKEATIPEPIAATESYDSYKLAPIVPITESNYRNGNWREIQKLLVNTDRKNNSPDFDENAKKAMQIQLDKVNKIKVASEEKEHQYSQISDIDSKTPSEYEYESEGESESESENKGEGESEDEGEDEGENENEDGDEYSVIEGNAKEKVPLNNIDDTALERQPIKYYSPTDRILEYIKTHQNTINPSFSTTAEFIGRKNEYDTTTPMGRHTPPGRELEVTENPVVQNTYSQQPNKNQLNLLFESPKDSLKPKSQTVTNGQSAGNLQTYMGRLVPIDKKASKAKDLSDLQNSNLVYVGDGVRLPLTIRKLPDGTFALTLSDEVCKQFLQKQCPCCLPNNNNGLIVREQKSIKDIPQWTISNIESERTTEKINSNTVSPSRHQRQYKDKKSLEVTPTTENYNVHIAPYLQNQQDSKEQIEKAPSKVGQNSNRNIYSRIRRESEERKESVHAERFADRENFVENSIDTSTQNNDNIFLLSLRDTASEKSSDEKTSQQDRGDKGLQIDNSETESFETQFDYQQEDPLDLGLHAIPRMIGPYRYQQLYAKENADALRNMLYMMKRIDSDEEQ